jgi:hypothetical protein
MPPFDESEQHPHKVQVLFDQITEIFKANMNPNAPSMLNAEGEDQIKRLIARNLWLEKD